MIKHTRRFGIGGLCLLISLLCLLPLYALADVDINSTTFPDAKFRAIVEGFDTSDDGKLSDAEIAAVTDIYVNNEGIVSLKGIEVFTAITTLSCSNNPLTDLPALPGALREIHCANTQLTALPTLPSKLDLLYCYASKLTALPALPDVLRGLYCYDNALTELPALPDELIVIYCNENQLTKLPDLPDKLGSLYCYDNALTELPTLPDGLQVLYCNVNQLTELPELPSGLRTLICNNNQLTAVDTSSLQALTEFDGGNQNPTLWLARNSAGSYSLAIELNNPDFNKGTILKYDSTQKILTSLDDGLAESQFWFATGRDRMPLSGTLHLKYGEMITASFGEGGSITPSGKVGVEYGQNQAFAIKADTGYRIKDVLVNGASIGKEASYTFENVQAAGSIAAQFEKIPYTVTASKTLGGSITPLGKTTVLYGGSQAYTITADVGHRIKDVKVNGKSIGIVSSYTFENVKADASIEASFEEVDYTITASAGKGGTISPAGKIGLMEGESQTFTLTAEDGYRVKDVKVNGKSLGVMSSYTFSNVQADATIEAQFEERPIDPVPPTGDRFPLEMLFVSLVGMVLVAVGLLYKAKRAN